MIELWNSLLQALAAGGGFLAALSHYFREKERGWFLLACFYGVFALGTLYWTLHLLLRRETPQIFYVSDLAWAAAYGFLLTLVYTLPGRGEKGFVTRWCWAVPALCLPQFVRYVTRGDVLSNVLMCSLTGLAAWESVRALAWAKRTGRAKRRRFDRAVLLFVGLEYALWTASCCWVSDDLRNPYFWFDFALSGGLLLLLPGVREAVEP